MGCMERNPGDHRTAAGSVNESKQGQPQAMNFVSKGPDNRAWDQLCKLRQGLRRWGPRMQGLSKIDSFLVLEPGEMAQVPSRRWLW